MFMFSFLLGSEGQINRASSFSLITPASTLLMVSRVEAQKSRRGGGPEHTPQQHGSRHQEALARRAGGRPPRWSRAGAARREGRRKAGVCLGVSLGEEAR